MGDHPAPAPVGTGESDQARTSRSFPPRPSTARHGSLRRTLLRSLALVLTLGASLSAVGIASAQETIDDARREREEVRREQARIAREIDVLEAERGPIIDALQGLDEAIAFQQELVAGAQREVDVADEEVGRIQGRIEELEREIDHLTDEASDLALRRYVEGFEEDLAWLEAQDIDTAVRRDVLSDGVRGGYSDVIDRLGGLERDLARDRLAAQEAVDAAAAARDELAEAVEVLEGDREVQAELEAALNDRIRDREGQVDELDSEEDELTAFIRERQREQGIASTPRLDRVSASGFIRPIDANPGSPFGNRRHPILGTVRLHAGVDFGAPHGASIWAAKEGEVIYAGVRGGYGNTVMVQHDGGIVTLYAHMSRLSVRVGARVERGQQVGLVGSTGLSTGPHLHFETRVAGSPRDPMIFIN